MVDSQVPNTYLSFKCSNPLQHLASLTCPTTNSLSFITSLELDLDSDDLDHESSQQLENSHLSMTESVDDDQRMPLLVGLFDSSASRRSLDDHSLPLRGINANGNSVALGDHTFDLDELAAKRTSGGSLLDSIANMANSILGAGEFHK